jgi:hypothetical protein
MIKNEGFHCLDVLYNNIDNNLESQQQASTSGSPLRTNEVCLNLFYDNDDYDCDT